MRARLATVAGLLLIGCSSDGDSASTTTGVPATTSTPADAAVEAVIDTGGGEALGLSADATSVWVVSFATSTMVKIDPATNSVLAVVDIEGSAATALAVGSDVWVAGYGSAQGTNLYRVHAESARVLVRHAVGELCCDLSYGDDSIWALDPSGFLLQVDVANGNLVNRFAISIDRNAHTNAVYFDGAVWFASDTTPLSRLQLSTGTVETFDVGGGVPFLARDGSLWGASATEVWAVDSSGAVVERIELVDSIEVMSLEVAGADLWVGIRHPGHVGAVQQIDRATGEVRQEFAIEIPARMVVAFGSLWVTDSGSSNVYRIGPV